ncbi:MAG TPA: chlorite dismutase family protein [Anaerolineales bacterium]|jgi:chlorite dismutase
MEPTPEENLPRSLNHFALATFKEGYWSLEAKARAGMQRQLLEALRGTAKKVDIYQATESGLDMIIWCALPVEDDLAPAAFFERFALAMAPFRPLLEIKDSLWGFTRPSQYSKAARSRQEIDPFAQERQPYLVIYPFSKTTEWFLMSREARQGMMNEHIRIGKQYEAISQLLLYSVGLQNQEFVVVYETPDLPRFSELVNELRDTEARRYTLRDTPLHTAIYHTPEETLKIWK